MLTVIAPPALEPVTLDEFVRDRRLSEALLESESSGGLPDALAGVRAECEDAIIAARAAVETFTRRAIITQTLQWVADLMIHPSPVWLPRPPVASVLSVTVDGEDLDQGDYALDAMGRLVLDGCPSAGRLVVITYTAGYGPAPEDVPADLRRAVLREAANLYEHREDNVTGATGGRLSTTARSLAYPYRVRLI